jgi:hypothetical protein
MTRCGTTSRFLGFSLLLRENPINRECCARKLIMNETPSDRCSHSRSLVRHVHPPVYPGGTEWTCHRTRKQNRVVPPSILSLL